MIVIPAWITLIPRSRKESTQNTCSNTWTFSSSHSTQEKGKLLPLAHGTLKDLCSYLSHPPFLATSKLLFQGSATASWGGFIQFLILLFLTPTTWFMLSPVPRISDLHSLCLWPILTDPLGFGSSVASFLTSSPLQLYTCSIWKPMFTFVRNCIKFLCCEPILASLSSTVSWDLSLNKL